MKIKISFILLFLLCVINHAIVISSFTAPLSISYGGTAATTDAGVRTSIGLGNVNNTSDANKPISTLQQTALNLKQNIASMSAYALAATYPTGSILYSTGSTLTPDNSNLFWDGTNHRLGLGMNTPSATLDVLGNINTNGFNVATGGVFTSSLISNGSFFVSNQSQFGVAGKIQTTSGRLNFQGFESTTSTGNMRFQTKLFNICPWVSGTSYSERMRVTLTGVTINTDLVVTGSIKSHALTESRVLASDASKNIVASNTTSAELGYLNGVTSSLQNQLDSKQNISSMNAYSLSSNTVTTNYYSSVTLNQGLSANTATITTLNVSGIVGVVNGSNATTGNVGQYLRSFVSSANKVTLTTNVYVDITNVMLSAGDWEVNGNVTLNNASGSCEFPLAGFGTGSGNSATGLVAGDTMSLAPLGPINSADLTIVIPTTRYSVTSPTPIYLKTRATVNSGTIAGYGKITARRVR